MTVISLNEIESKRVPTDERFFEVDLRVESDKDAIAKRKNNKSKSYSSGVLIGIADQEPFDSFSGKYPPSFYVELENSLRNHPNYSKKEQLNDIIEDEYENEDDVYVEPQVIAPKLDASKLKNMEKMLPFEKPPPRYEAPAVAKIKQDIEPKKKPKFSVHPRRTRKVKKVLWFLAFFLFISFLILDLAAYKVFWGVYSPARRSFYYSVIGGFIFVVIVLAVRLSMEFYRRRQLQDFPPQYHV